MSLCELLSVPSPRHLDLTSVELMEWIEYFERKAAKLSGGSGLPRPTRAEYEHRRAQGIATMKRVYGDRWAQLPK